MFRHGLWAVRLAVLWCISGAAWAQAPANPKPGPLTGRDLSVVRVGGEQQLSRPMTIPRGYAVVIGISDYKNLDAGLDLAYAEADAELVYNSLISKEAGNIPFQNVKKLVGAQATRRNIRETLEEWLPSVAREQDRVVVYFVGHGLVDEQGRGYLAPYDVDSRRLQETAIPMSLLGEVMSQKVKARWKVLLTDACHSGKVTAFSTLERVNDSFRDLPLNFLTITSSRESESSYEDSALAGGHGVFSYFLVKGWEGEADVDPADGVVGADELVAYLRREVRQYVRDRGAYQNPNDRGDYDNELALGFSQNRREKLASSVRELANGTIVVEANLDGVEVYVDDRRIGLAKPGMPLRVPGLSPGQHTVRGVRQGYQPAETQINVVPGSTQTVSLRILYQRKIGPEAQARFDEGERIWRRSNASAKDLQDAAQLFRKALDGEPEYAEAAYHLCLVQHSRGRSDDATASCRRALDIEQVFPEARVEYGILMLERGDPSESARQLRLAVAQNPKDAFSRAVLAAALLDLDECDAAETEANAALELDDSLASGFLMRGEARLCRNLLDEAIGDYQRVVALNDFDSGVLRRIAFWAVGSGVTKHRSGRRALFRSQNAVAYFGLCAAENGRRNFLRSIRHCGEALGLDKTDVDAHFLIAQDYAQMFNLDNRREYLSQAQQHLEEALRINPGYARAGVIQTMLTEIREYSSRVR